MSAEEALHFGLIPRMHRGIFAMNELPDLDELVQVGLFNILEERDVQIRGYPIKFDIDVLILFSANPSTYNRSGKVIPQLKDRIGADDPHALPAASARWASRSSSRRRASISTASTRCSCRRSWRRSSSRSASPPDGASTSITSPASAPGLSIANYRTMVASARQRAIRLGERPAVPRISDLGHSARLDARASSSST